MCGQSLFSLKLIAISMEKKSYSILDKVARRDGMTVPDGFFEDFAARMSESLPFRKEAEEGEPPVIQKSVWAHIRPYVYMAAMFAGIWCMLKMFTLMSPSNVDLSIDKNQILTEALGDDNFIYEYMLDGINERELFDEMYDDSISIDEMTPADRLPDVGVPAGNFGMPDGDVE